MWCCSVLNVDRFAPVESAGWVRVHIGAGVSVRVSVNTGVNAGASVGAAYVCGCKCVRARGCKRVSATCRCEYRGAQVGAQVCTREQLALPGLNTDGSIPV